MTAVAFKLHILFPHHPDKGSPHDLIQDILSEALSYSRWLMGPIA
jgi:hypothetical protein